MVGWRFPDDVPLFLCVFIVSVHRYIHTCAHMWRPKDNLGGHYSLETSSLVGLKGHYLC